VVIVRLEFFDYQSLFELFESVEIGSMAQIKDVCALIVRD
jgi:hypothetical protein